MANSNTQQADTIAIDVFSDSMDNSYETGEHNDTQSMEQTKQALDVRERYPNLAPCMGRRGNKEIAKEDGRKGGIKSGQTKRKRKLLRESAQMILSADMGKLPLPEMQDLKAAFEVLGINEVTGADAIMLAQYLKASRGDTEAARFVRDTSGEKPSVDLSVTAMDRPIDADAVSAMTDDELATLIEGAEDALPQPQDQKLLQ